MYVQLHPSPESEYIWVSPDRALIFPSTNYVRNIINKAAVRRRDIPVVLDCTHISSADFTTAKGFKGMISDFKSRSQPIIFYNTHSSVLDTFLGVNVEDFTIVHSLDELHSTLHGKKNRNRYFLISLKKLRYIMIKNHEFKK